MKKKFKKIISIVMIAAVIASICIFSTVSTNASGTGVGLAEWALNAYYSNWSYVYGGATPGTVDCSGLIYSYAGGYRGGDAQTFNSDYRYSLSGSIPNIHGLGLYKPGHVGVYVGDGMAVDARGSEYGVCYESVWSHGWTQYFKVPGVSYPDTGWVEFDGDYYYYENGEYLADVTRTIDGETYYFASSGKSSTTPSDTSSTASDSNTAAVKTTQVSADSSASIKKGSTGSKVEKLQERLQELGYYTGAVDGEFGDMTETAFKQFQQAAGVYVDGIAGSDFDLLFEDNAPAYKAETKTEEKSEEATEADSEKEAEITSNKEDLAETGVIPEVLEEEAAVEKEPAAAMLYSTGDYSEDILKIQERLISLGYLTGIADGEFGNLTEIAIKDFQLANGLEATGIVEQSTYDKLFSGAAMAAKTEEAAPAAKEAEVKNTANLPAAGNTPAVENKVSDAPVKQNVNAPKTEVEQNTSELSSKSVAAVAADSSPFKRGANGTNIEFILWLAIMIAVMLITFTIVYAVEKKKHRAARGRRFQ